MILGIIEENKSVNVFYMCKALGTCFTKFGPTIDSTLLTPHKTYDSFERKYESKLYNQLQEEKKL